jgi:hypothetical protein
MRKALVAGGLAVTGVMVKAAIDGQRFTRAIQEVGTKMAADIREMREWGDELERILGEAGVPRRRWRSEWFIPPRLRPPVSQVPAHRHELVDATPSHFMVNRDAR